MTTARVSALPPLLLPLLLLVAPSAEAQKLGVCPALPPGTIGTCIELCSSDDACPGEQKCCSNGCGHTCVQPQQLHPIDPLPDKPGACRYVNTLLVRCPINFLLNECKGDWDCKGSKKCCNVGCMRRCSEPVEDKDGLCPYVDTRLIKCAYRPDLDKCQQDWQCPGEEKCCTTGCSKICQEPVKPGSCPIQISGIYCFRYQNDCSSDYECAGDKKCCAVTCGVGCVEPVKVKDSAEDEEQDSNESSGGDSKGDSKGESKKESSEKGSKGDSKGDSKKESSEKGSKGDSKEDSKEESSEKGSKGDSKEDSKKESSEKGSKGDSKGDSKEDSKKESSEKGSKGDSKEDSKKSSEQKKEAGDKE